MTIRMPAPSSPPISDALALLKLALNPEARQDEINELMKARREYDDSREAAEEVLKQVSDLAPRVAAVEASEAEARDHMADAMNAQARLAQDRADHEKHVLQVGADHQQRAAQLDQRESDLNAREAIIVRREQGAQDQEDRNQKMNTALNEKEQRLSAWHEKLRAAVKE